MDNVNEINAVQDQKTPEQVSYPSTFALACPHCGNKDFKIIGTKEADINNGKMSDESPIGAAIMGKKVGEEVDVETPTGIIKFKVLEIRKEEED